MAQGPLPRRSRVRPPIRFAWQRGYASFSIGPRDLDAVIASIDGQEEHHRTKTFQDEYRHFLRHYGIEFDERYVWD